MAERQHDSPDCDGWVFTSNVRNFPPDELARYAGQFVAWNLDGTAVLASGASYEDLDRKLLAAGIDPNQVVHAYVPAAEEHTFLL